MIWALFLNMLHKHTSTRECNNQETYANYQFTSVIYLAKLHAVHCKRIVSCQQYHVEPMDVVGAICQQKHKHVKQESNVCGEKLEVADWSVKAITPSH